MSLSAFVSFSKKLNSEYEKGKNEASKIIDKIYSDQLTIKIEETEKLLSDKNDYIIKLETKFSTLKAEKSLFQVESFR